MLAHKASVLSPNHYGFWARPLVAALLFLTFACGSSLQPTPPLDQRTWCSNEERLAVMQVSAPTISVPDLANCTVQLQVQADRTLYDRSDYISVTARFSTQGDCAMLHTPTGWAAGFAFYMFSIQIVNQSGEMAPLTAEGQWWREDFAFKLFENGKWFRGEQPLPPGETRCYRLPLDRWYDLAAPGTYTLTLEYRGVTETNPEGVIGNPVIFTRRP